MARISFVELPVKSLEDSERFFSDVFGWKLTAFGPAYACTLTGDVDLGLQADTAEATATPLIVVEVDDLEQGLKAVQAAGGRITRQPFSFPGGRRFHFREPGGNELAAFEADQPAHQE